MAIIVYLLSERYEVPNISDCNIRPPGSICYRVSIWNWSVQHKHSSDSFILKIDLRWSLILRRIRLVIKLLTVKITRTFSKISLPRISCSNKITKKHDILAADSSYWKFIIFLSRKYQLIPITQCSLATGTSSNGTKRIFFIYKFPPRCYPTGKLSQ